MNNLKLKVATNKVNGKVEILSFAPGLRTIATVNNSSPTKPDSLEIANLLAAAPEMLAALYEARSELTTLTSNYEKHPGLYVIKTINEAIEKATT